MVASQLTTTPSKSTGPGSLKPWTKNVKLVRYAAVAGGVKVCPKKGLPGSPNGPWKLVPGVVSIMIVPAIAVDVMTRKGRIRSTRSMDLARTHICSLSPIR